MGNIEQGKERIITTTHSGILRTEIYHAGILPIDELLDIFDIERDDGSLEYHHAVWEACNRIAKQMRADQPFLSPTGELYSDEIVKSALAYVRGYKPIMYEDKIPKKSVFTKIKEKLGK